MAFETRTIEDDINDLSITVLAEGERFSMLTLKAGSDFIDGESWIKWKLFPALEDYVYNSNDESSLRIETLEVLKESELPKDCYLTLFIMLNRAEALGWFAHIPYPNPPQR